MIKQLIVICLLLITGASSAQLPKKLLRLEGEWHFKSANGYDIWKVQNDELVGESYRITRSGDSLLTDNMLIRKVNKQLIHIVESDRIISDSIHHISLTYIGGKRKPEFINVQSTTPYSVTYKFGFLNRNRLIILIKFGADNQESRLVMERLKK